MGLIDSASLVVTPNSYKATKLYSIIPDNGSGDMTFARTGDTATRVNSSGLIAPINANIPRLDYLGGGCPKLLLEPQRTNSILYSSEQENALWVKLNATVSVNAIASPDGTTNADKTVETSTSGEHAIYQTFTLTPSTNYTVSVYLKAGERSRCNVRFTNLAGQQNSDINLATGTANIGTLENVGNGWFRYSRVLNSSTGISSPLFAVFLLNASGQQSYVGDGTSGLYVWGAQLEVGAYATSYIPTTTASVTRNQDTCEKTSATALIGQTEGTIFADFVLASLDESRVLIGDGTASNRIYLRVAPNGSLLFEVIIGTVTLATISTNVSFASIGTRYKLAGVYKTNDFAFYVNGVQIGVDTSGTIANALTRFAFDGYITTYANFNHKINSLALWKTRLSNQELATLTTL